MATNEAKLGGMYVWDSLTHIATNGEVSTYRWEPSEEDELPPLPADASVGQKIGRVLCYAGLAGLFGFMWWVSPV